MRINSRTIWVQFQREGIHKYPAAATDPNLSDVAYLANDHRHIFHFRVEIEVKHDDRDIEFIQFKKWLESLYQGTLQLNYRSCEMIAIDLSEKIHKKYPGRNLTVSVSEDNENGATVQSHHTHSYVDEMFPSQYQYQYQYQHQYWC